MCDSVTEESREELRRPEDAHIVAWAVWRGHCDRAAAGTTRESAACGGRGSQAAAERVCAERALLEERRASGSTGTW